MRKRGKKLTKDDLKLIRDALKDDPFKRLRVALIVTSIIPFMAVYYLLYDELARFEIFIGYHGLLLILAFIISLLGYFFTYALVKTIIEKIIFFAIQMKKDGELKLNLISSISHEVKNPLASLVLGVENLKDGLLGAVSQKQKEYLDSSFNVLTRMGRILNNVLYALKLETGKVDFDMKEHDIDSIINDALSIYRPLFEKKYLDIDGVMSAGSGVKCDRDKILEVFDNLFGNISKYAPERGKVTISSKSIGGKIIIECENSGEKMSDENIKKIFDAFHKIDNSKEGVGLGLSIAKQIIEFHKGTIEALPGSGGGLKFVITLPKSKY